MGNATGKDKMRHYSGEDSLGTLGGQSEDFNMFTAGPLNESGEFSAGSLRAFNQDQYEPAARGRSRTMTEGPVEPEAPKKLPTVFKWDKGGKNVYIMGSFDNWQKKIPLSKSHDHDGEFYTIINLPEGTHQYRFNVDGQWMCDNNEPRVPNSLGTENNCLTVRSSDFEVFEALDMDSLSVTASGGSKGTHSSVDKNSPPGDYSQEIPARSTTQGFGYHHSGPPILPPHLLQVILNKEVSQHCEPTLLPEPNHVMLNHLYALSIKDGVMVLSSTHRYRKKYVTTLLYKPI